ncbi:TipJ family phage tail tip protein [Salinicola sp. V024]|uniref:TipJ family phage tail tip protein n=1 Tax=Salinicola sp. V024 TaxID=3459609 RepID=UPI00404475A2
MNEVINIVGAKGGKGGGGSGRVAQEDPNTLQSNATAKIIDLIGEGEIVGLVDGAKSIYIDDTPLQNDDDSFNFSGIEWDERVGLTEQDYVSGFDGVEATTDVSTQVTKSDAVVRAINDTDIDAVRVTIQIPALTEQDKKTGDLHGSSVQIAIDVASADSSYTEVKKDTISGKTTSPYQRSYRIPLTGNGPWNIRVRRLTDDNEDDSSIRNDTYWSTYTTIIDGKFVYPDSAYLALKVDASRFGDSIPDRAYQVRGLIVQIPSNYDPESREYSGIWDGTFKRSWTNNPAWIFYDLCTNKRYGAGIDAQHVDKWSLYQIGVYCDEYVDDGYGDTEPRFTVNTVLNSRSEVFDVLNSLAGAFRGMMYWSTGLVTAVQDAPSDSSRFFNTSNIVDGEFKYSASKLSTRHTVCAVSWNDPDDNYRKTVELVEDQEAIQKYGFNQTDITAFGCTSRGQARRLGLWTLYTEQSETELLEFSTGFADADLRPGEIISISDPNYVGARIGGRLVGNLSTQTTLYIDKQPEHFDGANRVISVRLPSGSTEHVSVSSINDDVITLATSLSETPLANAPWMLSSADVSARTFRVLSVTDNDDNSYTISAIEHNKNKFAQIEQGLKIPESPTTLLPTGRLNPPLDISIESYTYIAGGQSHQGLTISWTPADDPRVRSYVVEAMSPTQSAYEPVGGTALTSIDLRDTVGGQWSVRVAAVDSIGNRSAWSVRTTTISALLLPVGPDSVAMTLGTFDITLIPSSSRPGQLFEYRRSNTALDTSEIESNAVFLGYSTTLVDTSLKSGTTYYYYIRGYNAYGVSVWYPVSGTTGTNVSDITDAVLDDLTKPGALLDQFENGIKDNADAIDAAQNQIDTAISDISAITVNVDQALADSQTALDTAKNVKTDFNSLESTVDNRVSSVETTVQTLSDDTQAIANSVTELTSSVNDNSATISNLDRTIALDHMLLAIHESVQQTQSAVGSASITVENITRVTEDESLAQRIVELNTTFQDNSANVSTQLLALSDADRTLTNSLTDLRSDFNSNSSSVSSQLSTLTDANQSLASDISSLESEYNSNKSSVSSKLSTLTNKDASLASDISSLESSFNSNKSSVSSQISALTSKDNAISQRIDRYEVEVDDQFASVESSVSAVYDKNNGAVAQSIQTVNVNGKKAMIGMQVGGGTATIAAVADTFAIINESNNNFTIPFVVTGGQTVIDNALIRNLKATNIDVDDLTSKISSTGELRVGFRQVDEIGNVARWNTVGLNDINGGTLSNGTIGDSVGVQGGDEGTFKELRERAYDGLKAKESTDRWTRTGTTLIDGGSIYADDAFIVRGMFRDAVVGTLQLENEAVFIPRSTYERSGKTLSTSWQTVAELDIDDLDFETDFQISVSWRIDTNLFSGTYQVNAYIGSDNLFRIDNGPAHSNGQDPKAQIVNRKSFGGERITVAMKKSGDASGTIVASYRGISVMGIKYS